VQWVTKSLPHQAWQTPIQSWWIPGSHYWRATNRGCLKTLLLQSSVRSNRRRTQHLLSSSACKQHLMTMLLINTIWPPKLCLRNLRLVALICTSRKTIIARMTNYILGAQGLAGISKMNVMKVISMMASPPSAGDDRPRLNSRGLTCEPVMLTSMRARMETMPMRMRKQKNHKPMMVNVECGRLRA